MAANISFENLNVEKLMGATVAETKLTMHNWFVFEALLDSFAYFVKYKLYSHFDYVFRLWCIYLELK